MATVLLVEPDKILAGNYTATLVSHGHSVVAALGGQAAVYAAEKSTPDIIVMELQLPEHNGMELLYELRSYPDWQDIPVVLLTMVPDAAIRFDENVRERLGIEGYLYKPQTKLSHLTRAVARLTDAK